MRFKFTIIEPKPPVPRRGNLDCWFVCKLYFLLYKKNFLPIYFRVILSPLPFGKGLVKSYNFNEKFVGMGFPFGKGFSKSYNFNERFVGDGLGVW